jgi:aryl-alcohol dehydrogenase-like predicted oxidoreductase
LLHEPRVMTVLPNIYDSQQLREFALAPESPELTQAELDAIDERYRNNFGLEEEPMKFKGTMTRESVSA